MLTFEESRKFCYLCNKKAEWIDILRVEENNQVIRIPICNDHEYPEVMSWVSEISPVIEFIGTSSVN